MMDIGIGIDILWMWDASNKAAWAKPAILVIDWSESITGNLLSMTITCGPHRHFG